jgi:hypothetical protein
MLWALSRRKELFGGNAALPQNARESARFDLTMIGNDAARCSAAHNDVAAPLPDNGEPQPLQGANGLGA